MPHSLEDRLQAGQLFIDNALGSPEVLAAFGRRGRDGSYFEQGRALLESVRELQRECERERGEATEALEVRNETWEGAEDDYLVHLELARIAFDEHAGATAALGLDGRREKSLDPWIEQADRFYTQLLANDEYKEMMAEYLVDEAELTSAHAAVRAVDAADAQYDEERAESESATERRDLRAHHYDRWLGRSRRLARVVLRKDRQRLEGLGMRVRS